MSLPFESASPLSPPVKPVSRGRFQLSIRMLMVVTALVAGIVALSIAPPVAAFVLMIIHALLLCFSVIAMISGRGWIRPFAIVFGLYLVGLTFALFQMHLPGPGAFVIVELVNLAIATAASLVGSVFHSYLRKRNGFVPVPNLPFLRNWLHNDPQEFK